MRFIESICFKDHRYHNLALHKARWTRTHERFFNATPPALETVLPEIEEEGIFKVRIVYDDKHQEVGFAPYQKREITSLSLVAPNPFDYSFKFEDRTSIEKIATADRAKDIIISIDGNITDSSHANLAFWDGKEWLTPKKPLLKGVRRAQLLADGKIKETDIRTSDLLLYQKVALINAMLDLGESVVPISAVS